MKNQNLSTNFKLSEFTSEEPTEYQLSLLTLLAENLQIVRDKLQDFAVKGKKVSITITSGVRTLNDYNRLKKRLQSLHHLRPFLRIPAHSKADARRSRYQRQELHAHAQANRSEDYRMGQGQESPLRTSHLRKQSGKEQQLGSPGQRLDANFHKENQIFAYQVPDVAGQRQDLRRLQGKIKRLNVHSERTAPSTRSTSIHLQIQAPVL